MPDVLRTNRLELRPFSSSDGAAVFAYSSDAAWARYQTTPHPYSESEAEQFVAELMLRDRVTEPSWAITTGREAVGIVSLVFDADHRIVVLGYGVHKRHWGEGLVSEAISVVLDQSFEYYPTLSKVRAHTDARNGASIRVLIKLGFLHEGTLRANQFAKGEFVDEAIYGLLRPEWACLNR